MVKTFKKLIICLLVLLMLFNFFAGAAGDISSVYAAGDDLYSTNSDSSNSTNNFTTNVVSDSETEETENNDPTTNNNGLLERNVNENDLGIDTDDDPVGSQTFIDTSNDIVDSINSTNTGSGSDEESLSDSADSLVGKFLNGFAGIITWLLRAVVVVIGSLFVELVYFILSAGGVSENQQTTLVSPMDIFFGNFPLTNINVFTTDDIDNDGFMYSLRSAIVGLFRIVDVVSIVVVIVLIIWAFVKRFLTVNPDKRSEASNQILDCAWILALVLLINFIVIGILVINDWLVGLVKGIVTNLCDEDIISSMTKSLQSQALSMNFTLGVGSTIAFIMLCWQTFKFAFQYILRFFFVSFLIIISPLMSVFYSRSKSRSGNRGSFNKWFNMFMGNVLIQIIDCVIFAIFVAVPMGFLEVGDISGTQQLAYTAFIIVGLMFVKKGEDTVMKLIGLDDNVISFGKITNMTRSATNLAVNAVTQGISVASNVTNIHNNSVKFGEDVGKSGEAGKGASDQPKIHESEQKGATTGGKGSASSSSEGSEANHQASDSNGASGGQNNQSQYGEDANGQRTFAGAFNNESEVDESRYGEDENGQRTFAGVNEEENENENEESQNEGDANGQRASAGADENNSSVHTKENNNNDTEKTHDETHTEVHEEKETTIKEVDDKLSSEIQKKDDLEKFKKQYEALLKELKKNQKDVSVKNRHKQETDMHNAGELLDKLEKEMSKNTYKDIQGKEVKFNAYDLRRELDSIYRKDGSNGINDYINKRKDAPQGSVQNAEKEFAKEYLNWTQKVDDYNKSNSIMKSEHKDIEKLLSSDMAKELFSEDELKDLNDGLTKAQFGTVLGNRNDVTESQISKMLDKTENDINKNIADLNSRRDDLIKEETEIAITPERINKLTKNKDFENMVENTMAPMQVVDGKIDVSYENISRITTNFEHGSYSDEKLEAIKAKIASEGENHGKDFSKFCDYMNENKIAEATRAAKGLTSESEKEGVRFVTEKKVGTLSATAAVVDYTQEEINNNTQTIADDSARGVLDQISQNSQNNKK